MSCKFLAPAVGSGTNFLGVEAALGRVGHRIMLERRDISFDYTNGKCSLFLCRALGVPLILRNWQWDSTRLLSAKAV